MQRHNMNYSKAIPTVLLCVFILIAMVYRSKPIINWPGQPNVYFANQEPVLSNLDGYYYLNNAKRISLGTFSATDPQRAFPTSIMGSVYPSLLAVILHYLSSFLHVSLNWVGVFLPVIFGSLIVIPTFLFSKQLGSTTCVIGSLALAAVSPHFLFKSSVSWLDTDCLNVFFPFLCAFFFMRFGLLTSSIRYVYFIAGLICSFLFLWWWNMSPEAVFFLSLAPALLAILFHYRPPFKEGLCFILILLSFLVLIVSLLDPSVLINIFQTGLQRLIYISKKVPGSFGNMGISIQEQQSLSFYESLLMVFSNLSCAIVGMCGVILLFIRKKNIAIYLIPVTIIGVFSFLFAKRFTIFLTPIYSLGFGYWFFEARQYIHRKTIYYLLYSVLLISLFWTTLFNVAQPNVIFDGNIIEAMQKIETSTEHGSVVWSWWDQGHPLVYWSGRKTINDGMVHGGLRNYFTALPLASSNQQFAANFMHFYSKLGTTGIRDFFSTFNLDMQTGMAHITAILSNGPEVGAEYFDLHLQQKKNNSSPSKNNYDITFFYPEKPENIYLLLDSTMISSSLRWIYWFGTWDSYAKQGLATLPIIRLGNIDLNASKDRINNGFKIDVERELFFVNGITKAPGPYATLYTELSPEEYPHRSPKSTVPFEHQFNKTLQGKISSKDMLTNYGTYDIISTQSNKKVTIIDRNISSTVLLSLFTRPFLNPNNYYKLIENNYPHSQIWQVIGDTVKQVGK